LGYHFCDILAEQFVVLIPHVVSFRAQVILVFPFKPLKDIFRTRIITVASTVRVILALNLFEEGISNTMFRHLYVVVTSEELLNNFSYFFSLAISIWAEVLLQLIEHISIDSIEASQFGKDLRSDYVIFLRQINVLIIVLVVGVEDLLSDGICQVIHVVISFGRRERNCGRCVRKQCRE